jgi:hypothetical protein
MQLNKYNYYINYIRPLSKKKITNTPLKWNTTALLYNSPMLSAVQNVLNLDYNDAYIFMRNLCSSSIEFLEIFNIFDFTASSKFNEYIFYHKRCSKCTFVHAPINTDIANNITLQIKQTYKLLSNEQIEQIINKCCIKTYL